MQPHTINVKALRDFTNHEKVTFASGPTVDGGRKQLYVTLNGNYEVHVNNEKIYEANQPRPAVLIYNAETNDVEI